MKRKNILGKPRSDNAKKPKREGEEMFREPGGDDMDERLEGISRELEREVFKESESDDTVDRRRQERGRIEMEAPRRSGSDETDDRRRRGRGRIEAEAPRRSGSDETDVRRRRETRRIEIEASRRSESDHVVERPEKKIVREAERGDVVRRPEREIFRRPGRSSVERGDMVERPAGDMFRRSRKGKIKKWALKSPHILIGMLGIVGLATLALLLIEKCKVKHKIGDEESLKKIKKFLNESYNQSPLINRINFKRGLFREEFMPIRLEANSKPIDENVLFDDADRLMVVAGMGEGKTTWLAHVTLLWNQGKLWSKEFALVFFIQLPDLVSYYTEKMRHEEELIVADGIAKFCLTSKNFSNEENHYKHEIDQLLVSHADEILFILDNYDEVEHELTTTPQLELIIKKFLQKKHVLVTTRSYSNIYLNSIFEADKTIFILNFIDGNQAVIDYVNYFFPLLNLDSENKPIRQPDKLEKLKNDFISFFLKDYSNSLYELLQKPLFLQLICEIWEIEDRMLRKESFSRNENSRKNNLNELTITSIHRKITAYLVKRFLEKEAKKQGKNFEHENFEVTLKREKYVLDFVKEVANHDGNGNMNLLKRYADKASMELIEFEYKVLGVNLITAIRYADQHIYRFTYLPLETFFSAWYKADQFINGAKPTDIISAYNLKKDRTKWTEHYSNWREIQKLAYIAGILWVEQKEKELEIFIDFLFGENIDKYTLPLAITLFEEIRFIPSEHVRLDAVRNKIVELARDRINSLLEECPEYLENDFFAQAIQKTYHMKYYIISRTDLNAIKKNTSPNIHYIRVIAAFHYFNEETIQYLLHCLSSPHHVLRGHAKNALTAAKIGKEIMQNSFCEEEYRDNLNVEVIQRKTALLLELGYIDEIFLNRLLDKSVVNEKKRMLAVTAISVMGVEHKKKVIFDYLLDTLGKFPNIALDINHILVNLGYFKEEENLKKFSLVVSSVLRDEKTPKSIIAYLQVLNNLPTDVFQKITIDNSDLISSIIKLLNKNMSRKIEVVEFGIYFFSKLNTEKAFSQLVRYSDFFIEPSQTDYVSRIRGNAITGLINFSSDIYFERILDCLKERLSDPREVEINKIKAINAICTLDKIGDPLKINLVLLNYFSNATANERKLIAEKIKAQPINEEIDVALQKIFFSSNIALFDKKNIIFKFIFTTGADVTKDILLNNKDSILYEVSKLFIDEKVVTGLFDVLAMPKCPANIKAKIRRIFIDLLSSTAQKEVDLIDVLVKIIDSDNNAELRTKFFMDELDELPFNSITLTILIKILEINLSLDFKEKICGVLDKFYNNNKGVFISKLHELLKKNEEMGEKFQMLSLLQRVNEYYSSWSRFCLYDYLKLDLKAIALANPLVTSAATRSTTTPFWVKPLHLLGNVVGTSFQYMKAMLGDGVPHLVGDGLYDLSSNTVKSNIVPEVPDLIAEASPLVKTSTFLTINDVGIENSQGHENDAIEADNHFTADHASSSVQTSTLTPIALGYVAIPLINKVSERFGLFGHKPLVPTLAAQYEIQHQKILSEMKTSLDNMKRHLVLKQRIEYQLAQEAFEQAYQRFKNYFRNVKLSNHAISESKNAEVLRLIDIAQQAFIVAETLQMRIDEEYPEFVHEIERMIIERNNAWEELQKIACVFADEIEKLQAQQNTISKKLMIDNITVEEELLEQEWNHFEKRIAHIRDTQKKLEPICDAVIYLLGRISDQLELGCLPEQFVYLQNELILAKAAITEMLIQNTNLEEGLLAEVIIMVDSLREAGVDKIYSQHVRQAVILETQNKTTFSNFFKMNQSTEMLTSTASHAVELTPS